MIDALRKIIKSEVQKETKKNVYKKTIKVDNNKIKTINIGKLSY